MSEDKRVVPRYLFSEPVAYGHPEISVNGSIAGNISLNGISLKVQGFVPMGTTLELQLRLGNSPEVIWVKAQVVRVRQVLSFDCFEIGLRFVKDEITMRAIGRYIMSCRSNQ